MKSARLITFEPLRVHARVALVFGRHGGRILPPEGDAHRGDEQGADGGAQARRVPRAEAHRGSQLHRARRTGPIPGDQSPGGALGARRGQGRDVRRGGHTLVRVDDGRVHQGLGAVPGESRYPPTRSRSAKPLDK